MLTPQEKQAHDEGMTGSKIARIITGKFGGAFAVYHEMKGLFRPDQEYSKFLAIGNALEPVVRQDYKQHTGFDIKEISTTYAKQDPWYRCHIDGKITNKEGEFGVLECKSANTFVAHEWANGPPDYPLIQCLFGMYCTGFQWGSISLIEGAYGITHWPLERDEELIQSILSYAEQFRKHLNDCIPPEVDGSADASEIIKSVYPKATFEGFTLDNPYAKTNAMRLHMVKQIEKAATKEKARLENVFKMHIQDKEGVHVPGFGNITWKNTKGTDVFKLDPELVKERYPVIYDECCRNIATRGHRMFLVSPDKKLIADETEKNQAALEHILTPDMEKVSG